MYSVYCIYCYGNDKEYIGITDNMKRRFAVHWNSKEDTVLNRTIKKYGKDYFDVHEIDFAGTWEEACKKECHYIKQRKSRTLYGMNMTDGGEGVFGLKHSRETRIKMSNSHKGKGLGIDNPMFGKSNFWRGKKRSEETRRKLSELAKKRTPWNKGKKCPSLSGENNSFYGHAHTEETKQRIRESRLGKKWTDNIREKILESRKGCQTGEKHSQAKLTEKDVLLIREDYQSRKYKQKELSEIYGVTASMISNIVRRKSWAHI